MADPAPGISAVPHDDNLRYFNVAITGPEGSPFERMSYTYCHANPSLSSYSRATARGCVHSATSISLTKFMPDLVFRRSV